MRFHVLVEVLLHVEVLAAPLAHELLVSDVDAHVGAQLVLVLEALVAVLKKRYKYILLKLKKQVLQIKNQPQ